MNIEDINQVLTVRNWREKAVALRDKASSGVIICNVDTTDISTVIATEPILQAIVDACNEEIRKLEAELVALGVTFESYLPTVDPRKKE